MRLHWAPDVEVSLLKMRLWSLTDLTGSQFSAGLFCAGGRAADFTSIPVWHFRCNSGMPACMTQQRMIVKERWTVNTDLAKNPHVKITIYYVTYSVLSVLMFAGRNKILWQDLLFQKETGFLIYDFMAFYNNLSSFYKKYPQQKGFSCFFNPIYVPLLRFFLQSIFEQLITPNTVLKSYN